MNIKKIIAAIVTGTMITAGFAGCGSTKAATDSKTEKASQSSSEASSDGKLTKIRIGIDSTAWSTPIRIAKQEGLFKKYGLDAEFTTFSWGIDTLNATVLHQTDMGLALDYATASRLGGDSKLKVIANNAVGSEDECKLYVNDPSIKTIKDLKGKNVAVAKGTVNELTWAKALRKYGLSENDVKYKPLSSDAETLAAFKSGGVSAAWFSSQTDDKLKDKNYKAIADYGTIDQEILEYYVIDGDYLKNNEKAVENVLRALKDANDVLANDKARAVADCAKDLKMPEDEVEKGIDSITFRLEFKNDDSDHLKEIADWSYEHGLFDNTFDLADYIDKEPLSAVVPDQVES